MWEQIALAERSLNLPLPPIAARRFGDHAFAALFAPVVRFVSPSAISS
jgi:hypothetical protein